MGIWGANRVSFALCEADGVVLELTEGEGEGCACAREDPDLQPGGSIRRRASQTSVNVMSTTCPSSRSVVDNRDPRPMSTRTARFLIATGLCSGRMNSIVYY